MCSSWYHHASLVTNKWSPPPPSSSSSSSSLFRQQTFIPSNRYLHVVVELAIPLYQLGCPVFLTQGIKCIVDIEKTFIAKIKSNNTTQLFQHTLNKMGENSYWVTLLGIVVGDSPFGKPSFANLLPNTGMPSMTPTQSPPQPLVFSLTIILIVVASVIVCAVLVYLFCLRPTKNKRKIVDMIEEIKLVKIHEAEQAKRNKQYSVA